MLGQGINSLIPPKGNRDDRDDIGQDPLDEMDEIEFPLPDISNGQPPKREEHTEISNPVPHLPVIEKEDVPRGIPKGSQSIFQIETDKIEPNPHQPRKNFDQTALQELASSIREFGVLQPLVVSKIEKETEFGTSVKYQLIAGERRLKASKMLGLLTVPAIVRGDTPEVEKLEISIIENIQRANLNPIESARAIARLQDEFNLTQREIAVRLGKSREVVANTLRLLNLPTDIQDAIAEGRVGESQARILLSIDDPAAQRRALERLLSDNLSVRELKRVVNKEKERSEGPSFSSTPTPYVDPETSYLKDQLEEALGTKVEFKRDGKSGKIIINFYSQEELNALMGKIFKQSDSQSL